VRATAFADSLLTDPALRSEGVGGLASRDGVTIDDMTSVATSFPSFVPLIERLQAGA